MVDTPVTSGGRSGAWWAMVLLATAALTVSSYLTFVALTSAAGPMGCGAGSGCQEVLGSKWSKVLGLPVSALAAGLYLMVLGALVLLRPGKQGSPGGTSAAPAAWVLLVACAAAIAGAAAWFIYLQAGIVRAWCPYCMVDHALGIVLAGLILWSAPRRMPRGAIGVAASVGVVAVAAVAVVQGLTPARIYLADLPTGRDFDLRDGGQRIVGLQDGALRLTVADEPHIGPVDAPRVMAMLFDYACPHCRRTHHAVRDYMAQAPGELVLVALPTPLNRACNPYAPEEPPARFDESCELAAIALAMHRADATKFEAFDAWMYEPQMPRSAAEARAHAAELVGEEALSAAISDDRVKKTIARNVEAYGRINEHERRLPVTLVPFRPAALGAIEDAAGIASLLETPREAQQETREAVP